jgi:hypothetical protein
VSLPASRILTSQYLDIKPALPSASYCFSFPYVADAEGERREIASIYQCHYRQAARKIDVGVGASQSIHDVAVPRGNYFDPCWRGGITTQSWLSGKRYYTVIVQ